LLDLEVSVGRFGGTLWDPDTPADEFAEGWPVREGHEGVPCRGRGTLLGVEEVRNLQKRKKEKKPRLELREPREN
jgi:hypothetical protein